ncbi:MAG: septation protein SepH [Pseudonocardia sp.]
MRALRVVGFDGEGDNGVVILEDLDRRERFTVPADERLRAAARGDVLRLGQMSMDLESQLRPREIQARVRAGASVEQVAEAAGVSVERIERFAYPVLLERSRFAELAQQAHPIREDGPDVRTLSEVVSHTFGLRGQEYAQAEWDSCRGEDNKWVVAVSWSVGHSDITARWAYHPGAHGGTVTALDEHATDLGDGQLSRPPRRVGPVIDFSKPETVDEVPAAAARTATDERPAPEPARSSIPPAKARAEKPAHSPPASAPEPAADQPTEGRSGTDRPADDEAPATAAPRPSTGRRPRKGKPVMPSWEDVLLGVKTQR